MIIYRDAFLIQKQSLSRASFFFLVNELMKGKIITTGLILFFFAHLISVMPSVKADEMFFVDFYVVDSQGTPLDGVRIEVTGIYSYDEIVYTESDGHAPRLELFSDHRNAQYNWTATYGLDSESGDFYVPDNYNSVDIVMLDVPSSGPTPTPTPEISTPIFLTSLTIVLSIAMLYKRKKKPTQS